MGKEFDVTLLTDARYVLPKPGDWYVENIHLEDALLTASLESRGLKVHRTHWDNPDFDWSQTRFAVFRTTWDYFDRFAEFSTWLDKVVQKTHLLNPIALIRWNMDKHYLADLDRQGIRIPPTVFIDKGEQRSLAMLIQASGWKEVVIKPAVGGAGRHTYRLRLQDAEQYEAIFGELIAKEAMLLQEFLENVPLRGEITLMLFGGKYSHSVLKKAKAGDFRVQDDFGGTVQDYKPSQSEITFAEKVMELCHPTPLYGRVDLVWDNQDQLCVSELELIEPELWMRNAPASAELFAEAIAAYVTMRQSA